MPRTCLFCGEPANSREDAFPQWLNTLAPLQARALNTRESGTRGWLAGGFDHKVRQVCKRCNNGWMSQLEVASKPLVTELASDDRTAPLSVGEQTKLAAWLYKTAIMLALAYPAADRYVPKDHYRGFSEHRKAPRGTTIWIGGIALVGEEIRQIGWSRPERLEFHHKDGTPTGSYGYRLSFSVFALVAQIMWDPNGGKFAKPREVADVWTRVQPISKGRWPPGRWISETALEGLAGGPIYSGPQHAAPRN